MIFTLINKGLFSTKETILINNNMTFIIKKDKDNRYYIENGFKELEYVANYDFAGSRIKLEVIGVKDNQPILLLYNDWINTANTKEKINNDELLNDENNTFNTIVLSNIMKIPNNLLGETIVYIDPKNKALYLYNDNMLVGFFNENFVEIKEEGLNQNQIALIILIIYFTYLNTNWSKTN